MCFTIPQKVIEATDNKIIVENRDQSREEIRTLLPLEVGDYVLVVNGIAIEKMPIDKVVELFKILDQ